MYASNETTRLHTTERSLTSYHDGLIDVLREGLRTEDLKTPAIKGSVSLIEIPDFVTRDEVEDIVKAMDNILINSKDPELR